jgi:hypothetical protein
MKFITSKIYDSSLLLFSNKKCFSWLWILNNKYYQSSLLKLIQILYWYF